MVNKLAKFCSLLLQMLFTAFRNGGVTARARRRAAIVWRLRDINHGKRVIVGPGFNVNNRNNLSIGNDVMFTNNTLMSCTAPVCIGSKVMIGPGCIFHTTTHDIVTKIPEHKEIIVEDGVWIAANVTVTCGVTIGENSVIAAGSVVTKNIPPGVVAGGVPAKILKNINADAESNTRFVQSDWLSKFN